MKRGVVHSSFNNKKGRWGEFEYYIVKLTFLAFFFVRLYSTYCLLLSLLPLRRYFINKLWGFVDLTGLPQNSGVSYGGLDDISPGLYAIVENASYGDEEHDTDLTRRIFVECDQTAGALVHNYVFYLADVEAFVSPCMVIPNIGGPSNSYLMVKEMAEWRTVFEEWLSRPHSEDVISDQEGANSDDEESEESDD